LKKKTMEGQMPLAGTEEEQILARLSERVDRAVKMIQDLRRERDELKARLESATDHEAERSEIRNRIEGILSSLEALEE
jgi:FtsZ-binding cell division protein ZapB